MTKVLKQAMILAALTTAFISTGAVEAAANSYKTTTTASIVDVSSSADNIEYIVSGKGCNVSKNTQGSPIYAQVILYKNGNEVKRGVLENGECISDSTKIPVKKSSVTATYKTCVLSGGKTTACTSKTVSKTVK
jgi:hypothetical protein